MHNTIMKGAEHVLRATPSTYTVARGLGSAVLLGPMQSAPKCGVGGVSMGDKSVSSELWYPLFAISCNVPVDMAYIFKKSAITSVH